MIVWIEQLLLFEFFSLFKSMKFLSHGPKMIEQVYDFEMIILLLLIVKIHHMVNLSKLTRITIQHLSKWRSRHITILHGHKSMQKQSYQSEV